MPASEYASNKIAKGFKVWACKNKARMKTHKKTRKSFCKSSFQLGMGLKKVQKQGRDERTHKDYPRFAKKYTTGVG